MEVEIKSYEQVKEQLNILKALVDAADISIARFCKTSDISASIDSDAIRKVFGWELSEDAVKTWEVFHGGEK